MRTDKYLIKDFLSFASLEQLVVPEIQRDYVWEVEHIKDLLATFFDGYTGSDNDRPYLGFIYAYNDKDHPYKYFVVDGQQRLTSIYLILVLCYQLIEKPLPSYLRDGSKLKLDYKVRQSTHDFLINLVNYCQANLNDHTFKIEEQLWFHSHYENDKTITNIIQNFYVVRYELKSFDVSRISNFIKYIETQAQLSYFDIETGREGEELYIYMNARGKQLEVNETLKARFLSTVNESEKLKWGLKWEEWQDFFWKHKGEKLDADAGFDEFLRRVQIVHMCALGKSNDQVSNFSSNKSNKGIDFELLPQSIDEIEEYFNAFKTMVQSPFLIALFEKYEASSNYLTETPEAKKRQIYYFTTLPVLAFVKQSKEKDEHSMLRFARFFYNLSRKLNIGKDIASQLPAAIKLVHEFVTSKSNSFDVVGLRNFSKNRTVLLDQEELFKLQAYHSPPDNISREELEDIFWSAEDHPIFKGEIAFLIQNEKEPEKFTLDIERFKNLWSTFKLIFPSENPKYNNTLIVRALLYYGNTWFQDSPYYYKNYDCADWYSLVRGQSSKYLNALLNDMCNMPLNHLDTIIKVKACKYFKVNNLNTNESIKATEVFVDQVKVLAALDYYSDKILWTGNNFYFAEDERYKSTTYGDIPFFNRDRLLYNIPRYIGDGTQNRIVAKMNNILTNEKLLTDIVNRIISYQ